MTDEYLTVESDASDAHPDIVADVFESVAESLRNAPEGKRYDFDIQVTEQ